MFRRLIHLDLFIISLSILFLSCKPKPIKVEYSKISSENASDFCDNLDTESNSTNFPSPHGKSILDQSISLISEEEVLKRFDELSKKKLIPSQKSQPSKRTRDKRAFKYLLREKIHQDLLASQAWISHYSDCTSKCDECLQVKCQSCDSPPCEDKKNACSRCTEHFKSSFGLNFDFESECKVYSNNYKADPLPQNICAADLISLKNTIREQVPKVRKSLSHATIDPIFRRQIRIQKSLDRMGNSGMFLSGHALDGAHLDPRHVIYGPEEFLPVIKTHLDTRTQLDPTSGFLKFEDFDLQKLFSINPSHLLSGASSIPPLSADEIDDFLTQPLKNEKNMHEDFLSYLQMSVESNPQNLVEILCENEENFPNCHQLTKDSKNIYFDPENPLKIRNNAYKKVLFSFLKHRRDSFRELSKHEYFVELSKAPMVAYLSSAHPSRTEIIKALDKIKAHNRQAIETLPSWHTIDPEEFPVITSLLISVGKDKMCDPAMDALKESNHQKTMKTVGKIAFEMAGIPLLCALTGPGVGTCLILSYSAIGAHGVYDTLNQVSINNSRMLAHPMKTLELGSLEKMSVNEFRLLIYMAYPIFGFVDKAFIKPVKLKQLIEKMATPPM